MLCVLPKRFFFPAKRFVCISSPKATPGAQTHSTACAPAPRPKPPLLNWEKERKISSRTSPSNLSCVLPLKDLRVKTTGKRQQDRPRQEAAALPTGVCTHECSVPGTLKLVWISVQRHQRPKTSHLSPSVIFGIRIFPIRKEPEPYLWRISLCRLLFPLLCFRNNTNLYINNVKILTIIPSATACI